MSDEEKGNHGAASPENAPPRAAVPEEGAPASVRHWCGPGRVSEETRTLCGAAALATPGLLITGEWQRITCPECQRIYVNTAQTGEGAAAASDQSGRWGVWCFTLDGSESPRWLANSPDSQPATFDAAAAKGEAEHANLTARRDKSAWRYSAAPFFRSSDARAVTSKASSQAASDQSGREWGVFCAQTGWCVGGDDKPLALTEKSAREYAEHRVREAKAIGLGERDYAALPLRTDPDRLVALAYAHDPRNQPGAAARTPKVSSQARAMPEGLDLGAARSAKATRSDRESFEAFKKNVIASLSIRDVDTGQPHAQHVSSLDQAIEAAFIKGHNAGEHSANVLANEEAIAMQRRGEQASQKRDEEFGARQERIAIAEERQADALDKIAEAFVVRKQAMR